MTRGWIGVDVDGTLAKARWKTIKPHRRTDPCHGGEGQDVAERRS